VVKSPLSLSSPRVLLVATTTGYQIRSFGEAAERLGVRLVFATDRCDRLEDPWWDQAIPIRFHEEDKSLQTILTVVRDAPLSGVLAVGDRPTIIAARVAEAVGLPGHPPTAARASRNKLATRAAVKCAGLSAPWFQSVARDCDPTSVAAGVRYPCVVKPLALSGSRGVMRADDSDTFVAVFNRLGTLLRSVDVRAERDPVHDTILIESFIPGREFALEGILHCGHLRTLALFDKPDPLDGPFFEETIYVTPSLLAEEDQASIARAVAAAARAVGLWHGPIHAECRINQSGVFVLEVAARPIGGLCSRALRFADGNQSLVTLEELLLRHAIGEDVAGCSREAAASGVMMIPIPQRGVYRDVAGVEDARRVPSVEDVRITAKPDQLLVPLPEGKSYLGFIFARANTPYAVDVALREAHKCLRFTIDRALT
jgi:biotin carboxylase